MRLLPCELSRIDVRERFTRLIGVVLGAFAAVLVLRSSCGTPEVLPPPVVVLLLLLCVPAAERPTAGFTAATAAGAGSAATLLVLLELLMLPELLGSLDFPWNGPRPFADAWFSSWMYLFDLPWSAATADAVAASGCGTAATAAGGGGCGLGT
jgi:hypothetical protein